MVILLKREETDKKADKKIDTADRLEDKRLTA
jgi:hypothetical protein